MVITTNETRRTCKKVRHAQNQISRKSHQALTKFCHLSKRPLYPAIDTPSGPCEADSLLQRSSPVEEEWGEGRKNTTDQSAGLSNQDRYAIVPLARPGLWRLQTRRLSAAAYRLFQVRLDAHCQSCVIYCFMIIELPASRILGCWKGAPWYTLSWRLPWDSRNRPSSAIAWCLLARPAPHPNPTSHDLRQRLTLLAGN